MSITRPSASELAARGRVLVELKAVSGVEPIQEAIVMSYLRTLGLRIGLLLEAKRDVTFASFVPFVVRSVVVTA